MIESKIDSDFLRYLITNGFQPGDRVPPLNTLTQKLGLSMSKLREQLEVARELGLVEVKPRSGIHCADYAFFPAIKQTLLFALALDSKLFNKFSDLRHYIEVSFFAEAVAELTENDKSRLQSLIVSARQKLEGSPIRIPHQEHRELHLEIFRRLDNPFVQGLLEAYWEAYEAVELNVYTDINYLHRLWDYHTLIIDGIINDDVESSIIALVEHTELLNTRDTKND